MFKLSGFTLLELLVVIAIIGILSAAVVVSLGGSTDAAEDAVRKQTLQSLGSLSETYFYSSKGGGFTKAEGLCLEDQFKKVSDKYNTSETIFICEADESGYAISFKLVEEDSDGEEQYIVRYDSKRSSQNGYSGQIVATAAGELMNSENQSSGGGGVGSGTQPTTPSPALSITSVDINEGATATYTVSLSAQPAADTILTITSSDSSAVTTSVASLTFTTANWGSTQTVTVSAIEDANTVR